MVKRMNIEKTIDGTPIKSKIGSINRTNPTSFYITGKAYITPLEEEQDYNEKVDFLKTDLNSIFKRFAKTSDFVNKMCITTLEVPSNGLKYGKNSYIWYMVFFSQNKTKDFNKIKETMIPGISICINEFTDKIRERGFDIREKRKQ